MLAMATLTLYQIRFFYYLVSRGTMFALMKTRFSDYLAHAALLILASLCERPAS